MDETLQQGIEIRGHALRAQAFDGVACGQAHLRAQRVVGTDPQRIVAAVERLLDDAALAASFAQRHNPYGDGRAAERIVGSLLGRSVDRFVAEAEGRACSG